MGIFRCLLILFSAGVALFSGDIFASYLTNSTYGTPTVYKITITKIEFKRADGSYYTFFEGEQEVDIASASQGGIAGTIGRGVSLEPGTSYTEVRFTVSRYLDVVATDGAAGFTDASGLMASQNGMYINIAYAPGPATQQRALFPLGGQADVDLAAAGMSNSKDYLEIYIDQPISITVPSAGASLPNIRLNFDIQDCVEFNTDDSDTTLMVPGLPSINLSVSE